MKTNLPKIFQTMGIRLSILVFAFGLSACGQQVQDWVRLDPKQPGIQPSTNERVYMTELVSGSHPLQPALPSNYQVSGSLGYIYSETVQTSSQGYKVYLSAHEKSGSDASQ